MDDRTGRKVTIPEGGFRPAPDILQPIIPVF